MEPTAKTSRSMPELCHLSGLAGMVIPLGNILGPLGIWLWKRDTDPVMTEHAREALNFQISMTIYFAVLVLAAVICLPVIQPWMTSNMEEWTRSASGLNNTGLPLSLFVPFILAAPFFLIVVAHLILILWATIKAYRGSAVRYPITMRFIRG